MITSLRSNLTLNEIKNKLSILDVLTSYGINIKKSGSNYTTNMNPLRDEKTSSLVIYANTNSYCDFGTMVGGDVIKFIQELEKCSFIEAIKKAHSIINGVCSSYITKSTTKIKQMVTNDESNTRTLENIFSSFDNLTFYNQLHRDELLNIAPIWLYKDANEADLDLFKSMCKFDSKNNTLVCGCYDNTSGLEYHFKGFKRRRFKNGKWVNAKGTKINDIGFVRVFTDEQPIYVVEGYHDLLVSILLGVNFIAIPTANFKNLNYFNTHNFSNRHFIFICEDATGYSGMRQIANHLASEAMLIDLIQLNYGQTNKLDLSDFILNFNAITEVKNALSNKR